jgi:hypothetical protein
MRGSTRRDGQALVLMALFVPLVLLPVAGYAIEATYAASRAALLQWACVRTAEDAAESIDVNALRGSSALVLDPAEALPSAERELVQLDPNVVMDSWWWEGNEFGLSAHENVPVPLALWLPSRSVQVGASATARLTPGYSSPSSRLPFPTKSFWVASAESPSSPSSSRHREGWMNG